MNMAVRGKDGVVANFDKRSVTVDHEHVTTFYLFSKSRLAVRSN